MGYGKLRSDQTLLVYLNTQEVLCDWIYANSYFGGQVVITGGGNGGEGLGGIHGVGCSTLQ